MRTTWKNHRIMDLLLVAALLSGCILSTSSEDIKRSVDVQNIFNHFDALIKLKSTVPTVSDAVCVTSVEELNEIENAFVPDYDRETVSRDAEISIKISPDCAKLDRVKSEIIKLRNDFGIVIAQPISSQIYRTLKTNFESKILQFVGSLEIAKKMESGDRLDMVVRFQNEFQPQQNRISEVLTKLETEQKRSNDANVQVAIEHLQQGKLDEAVAAFAIVTDHEAHVERAVMAVYGNDDHFANICRFIVRLPKLSRENGFKVVRDQLKKDNRMVGRHIWVLAAEVSRVQEKDRGILNDVFVHIKTMVQNNDFDSIAVILNKTGGMEAMKHFIPTLVQIIYEGAETGGVEKFLTFLEKITSVGHKLNLINELVLMLKSTDRMRGQDMSMIIFEIIRLRHVKSSDNKVWQKTVEMNLPVELRDLMYDSLCIKNAENNEYLFAGKPANVNQRHVHTSRTRTNEAFYWNVYFTKNGTKIHIRSSKYGDSVFLIDEGSRDDEHVLRALITSTLDGDKTAEFNLEMLGKGEFLIVNKYFEQLLYSPFDNEPSEGNTRPVFSKKYDPNNIDLDSKWIISVCRVPVHYQF